jgi:CheY-like chemotaxis protein
VKKQEPDIPILMITANVDLLPSKLEVDLLLPKPFQIAELREAIRKVSGVSATS